VRAPFETNSSVNGHYKTSLVCDRIRGSEHHRQPRCLGVRQNLIGHLAGGPYITLSFANQTCSTSEFVPRNHENNACAKYSSTHSKYRKVRLRSCCGLRPVAVVAVGQHVAECTYAPVPDGRLRPEAPHTAVSATPRKVQQASARCRSALVLGGATHALSASSSETDASPPSPCPSTSIVSSRKRRSQSAHGRLELLGQVKRDRRGGTGGNWWASTRLLSCSTASGGPSGWVCSTSQRGYHGPAAPDTGQRTLRGGMVTAGQRVVVNMVRLLKVSPPFMVCPTNMKPHKVRTTVM
jgi:hypothetical protein